MIIPAPEASGNISKRSQFDRIKAVMRCKRLPLQVALGDKPAGECILITPACKLVWLALLDFAGCKDTCYPGMRMLAAVAGVATSAAEAAIKTLSAAGAIRFDAQPKHSGKTNSYAIVDPLSLPIPPDPTRRKSVPERGTPPEGEVYRREVHPMGGECTSERYSGVPERGTEQLIEQPIHTCAAGAARAPAARKTRKPNPMFDAVAETFKLNPAAKSHASLIGAVVRDLKELGATPGEVSRRAALLRQRFPDLGPKGLVTHWNNSDGAAGTGADSRSRWEGANGVQN